jgi:hypothetical protein
VKHKKADLSSKSVRIENSKRTVQLEKPDKASSPKNIIPASIDIIPENKPGIPKVLPENPVLNMKPGATDLRQGPEKLKTVIKIRMERDPLDGNIYAFANKSRTTVKAVREKEFGTIMITSHLKEPVEWPEYQVNKPENIVTLSGKEKDDQLGKLGCPKNL